MNSRSFSTLIVRGPSSISRTGYLRLFSASAARPYSPLEPIHDDRVETFRQQCFLPEQPAILPRSKFRDLPALKHWFQGNDLSTENKTSAARLNIEYLQAHGADAFVPLELTELANQNSSNTNVVGFRQFNAPMSLFLEWMRVAETSPQSTRLYLAQCQLLDLPPVLREDFPTPDIVAQAGKGDVYDTNVWIGHPPTYTPLHRDPNPNLFVQLAGQKVVRLLAPTEGQALFSKVRQQLGKSGSREAAAFRGEEMMQGQERILLDEMVWGATASGTGYEAHLEAGDGLFIPKGWWHSIKGVGEGSRGFQNHLLHHHFHLHRRHRNFLSNTDNSSMQLSRTAYRIALLQLSVSPIFARAPIPSASLLNTSHQLQTPYSRLYTVLFPQCAPISRPLESTRQAHTMSTGPEKKEPSDSRPQEETNTQAKEQLALPSTEDSSTAQRLDLSAEGGSTISFDHLGPMVVNVDGTLARIGNWDQMTEIERKNTVRILGKRNKQRLDALKSAEAAQAGKEDK
ncbi:hypothetical protein N7495_000616 [Penicillium taxi]|uniref:uncharacterized protein n=1 Tax=Penicillium taxi TaxID=168475 RepID=UPI0025454B8B|nr:uncharacterized protein N7495_000616 [Penicillium taxi]KAJ5907934.1 hypothetical protein N7495_000616 [Penicillium taxi]